MATLTVTDDRLRQVDAFAKEEARSREDIVDEAIDIYVRAKEWDDVCAYGRGHALKHGITEDVKTTNTSNAPSPPPPTTSSPATETCLTLKNTAASGL